MSGNTFFKCLKQNLAMTRMRRSKSKHRDCAFVILKKNIDGIYDVSD